VLPLVVLVAVSLACGGGDGTSAPSGGDEEETVSLVLDNESSFTVCEVNISPSTEDTWGEDLLDIEIGPGSSHTFAVEPGEYDLRAVDCEGDTLDAQQAVDLSEDSTWTLTDVEEAGGAEGLDYAASPNFGEEDLSPDFVPDPFEAEVVAGGTVDVAALDLGIDCTGYASSAPDLRINWAESSGEVRIFFVADDDAEDTVLIVSDPSESWFCNDDFSGSTYDPMVTFDSAAAGQYDIWVATYSEDEVVAGTLYVTEMDYSPTDLP
jgi:hypothetical protein